MKEWFAKHQTDIMTGIGIAGMGGSAIYAVMQTPKAKDVLDAKKKELGVKHLKPLDFIKCTWKYYTLPIIGFGGGTACVISAHIGDKKAAAGYAAAYTATEIALAEVKNKMVETIGERKADAIKDSIIHDHRESDPPTEKNIVLTGKGDHLICIDFNNRYFRGTVADVEKTINMLNAKLNTGEEVSLADLCYELNCGGREAESDARYIWEKDRTGLIEFRKGGDVTSDGEPYLVIDFIVDPVYKFNDYM